MRCSELCSVLFNELAAQSGTLGGYYMTTTLQQSLTFPYLIVVVIQTEQYT